GDQSDVAKDQIEVGEAGVGGVAKGFEALADLEAGRSEEEVKHFAGGVGGDDGVTGGGREHGGDLTLDQSGEVVGAVLDDFSAAHEAAALAKGGDVQLDAVVGSGHETGGELARAGAGVGVAQGFHRVAVGAEPVGGSVAEGDVDAAGAVGVEDGLVVELHHGE